MNALMRPRKAWLQAIVLIHGGSALALEGRIPIALKPNARRRPTAPREDRPHLREATRRPRHRLPRRLRLIHASHRRGTAIRLIHHTLLDGLVRQIQIKSVAATRRRHWSGMARLLRILPLRDVVVLVWYRLDRELLGCVLVTMPVLLLVALLATLVDLVDLVRVSRLIALLGGDLSLLVFILMLRYDDELLL